MTPTPGQTGTLTCAGCGTDLTATAVGWHDDGGAFYCPPNAHGYRAAHRPNPDRAQPATRPPARTINRENYEAQADAAARLMATRYPAQPGDIHDERRATPPPTPAGTATPGPWFVMLDGRRVGHRGALGTLFQVADTVPAEDSVAGWPEPAARAANATLIAAAPELRDALAALVSAASVYSDLSASKHGRPALDTARTLLARLGVTL